LGAVVGTEFVQNVADVGFYRTNGDVEFFRNYGIAATFYNELQYL
jgi:hypothetical protein